LWCDIALGKTKSLAPEIAAPRFPTNSPKNYNVFCTARGSTTIMTASSASPLSETVISVFDQFIDKLEAESVLCLSARKSLAQSLKDQNLDHESLRLDLFKVDESPP
jgi:hypothetical protein